MIFVLSLLFGLSAIAGTTYPLTHWRASENKVTEGQLDIGLWESGKIATATGKEAKRLQQLQMGATVDGGWSGSGGGGGLSCRSQNGETKVFLLDLFENSDLVSFYPNAGESVSAFLHRWLTDHIEPISPFLGYTLRLSLAQVLHGSWKTVARMPVLKDQGKMISIPAVCELVQLVTRLSKPGSGPWPQVEMLVNEETFYSLSGDFSGLQVLQQSMLLVHEALYLVGAQLGHKDSSHTRKVTALLFSDGIKNGPNPWSNFPLLDQIVAENFDRILPILLADQKGKGNAGAGTQASRFRTQLDIYVESNQVVLETSSLEQRKRSLRKWFVKKNDPETFFLIYVEYLRNRPLAELPSSSWILLPQRSPERALDVFCQNLHFDIRLSKVDKAFAPDEFGKALYAGAARYCVSIGRKDFSPEEWTQYLHYQARPSWENQINHH